MVTLVLLLLTEATTQRKQTLAWTNTIPQTTECHKLFQKNVIHSSRHIIKTGGKEETGKSQMGRGHGSLTFATIE